MKPLLLAAVLTAIAIASPDIRDDLEVISSNWYNVGYTCGQADLLKSLGRPVPVAAAPCAKWNARFHNEAPK